MGAKINDGEQLDSLRDELTNCSTQKKATSVWNKCKADFLSSIGGGSGVLPLPKGGADVEITTEDSVINPMYYRTTKKYVYNQNQSIFSALGLEAGDLSFSLNGVVDYRIRTVTISIINNGSTVLSDYKMYMWFSGVEKVSNGEYFSPFETSEIRAVQNERRELFEVRDCETDLVLEPKNKRLVQNDSKTFSADVTPLEDAKEIIIEWEFLSDGYSKDGKISIPVEHVYEDRERVISVSSLIEEREEIVIEPKIINS